MELEEDCGFLYLLRKNGELGSPYPLGFGNVTIGSGVNSDIRLKTNDNRLELTHCVINVHDQGLATLVNKSQKAPVKINGIPVQQFQVLNNNDIFEVGSKKFKYVNEKITSENVSKLQKTLADALSPEKNRKSAFPLINLDSPKTPNTKMKTPVRKQLSKTTSKLTVSKPLSSRLTQSARKQRLSLGNSSRKSNLTPKISSRNILLRGPSKTPSKSILDSSVQVSVLKTPLKPTLDNAPDEDTTPVRRSNLSKSIIKSSTKKNLIKRHSSTPKIITPQRKLLSTPLRTPLNTISPIKKGVVSSTKKDTPDSKYLTPINKTMSSSRSLRRDNSVKSSQRSLLYESVQSKTNDTPNVSNVSRKSKKGNSSKLLTDNAPYLNQSGQSDVGLIVKSENSSNVATFNDSLDLNITDSIPNYSRISLEKAEEVERSFKQTSTPLKTPKPGKTPKSCLRRKALEKLTSDSKNNDTLSDLYTPRELEMIKNKLDMNESFNSFDTSAELEVDTSKQHSSKNSSVQFVESFTTPENNKSVVFINTPDKSEKSTRKSKKLNANSIITPSTTPKSAIKSLRKSLDETPQAHENTSMSAVKSRLTNLYSSNSEEMGKLSTKKGVKRGRESTGSMLHSTKKLKLSSFTSSADGDTSYDIMDALESNNSMSEGLPDYFSNLTDKPIIDEPRRNRSLTSANMRRSEKRRSLHPMKFESFNTYQSKLGRSKSYRSQEMLDDSQDDSVSGSSNRKSETEINTESQDSMSGISLLSNRKSVAEISNVDETDQSSLNVSSNGSSKKDIEKGSNASRRSRFSTRKTFDSAEVDINETTPNQSSHTNYAEESFSKSPLDATSNRSTRKSNVNEANTSKRSRLSTRKTLDADDAEQSPLDNMSKGSARKSNRFSTKTMEDQSSLDLEGTQESLHYSGNESSIENTEDDNNTSRGSRFNSRQTLNADVVANTPNKSRLNDTEQSLSYSPLETTLNTSKKSRSSTRKTLNIADAETPSKSLHLNVTEDYAPDSASKRSSRKSNVQGSTSRRSRLSTRSDMETNTPNKSTLDLDGTQESLHYSDNETTEDVNNTSRRSRVSTRKTLDIADAKTPNKSLRLNDTVESISSSPIDTTSNKSALDTSKKSRYSTRKTLDIANAETSNISLQLNDTVESISSSPLDTTSNKSVLDTSKKSRYSTRKTLDIANAETSNISLQLNDTVESISSSPLELTSDTPNKSLKLNDIQESTSKGSARKSIIQDKNTSRRSRLSTNIVDNAEIETNAPNKSTLDLDGTQESLHLSVNRSSVESIEEDDNTSRRSRVSTRQTLNIADSETKTPNKSLLNVTEQSLSALETILNTSAHNTSRKSRLSTVTPNKSLNLNDTQESTSKGSERKSSIQGKNTSRKSRLSTNILENADIETNTPNKSTMDLDGTQESLHLSVNGSSVESTDEDNNTSRRSRVSTRQTLNIADLETNTPNKSLNVTEQSLSYSPLETTSNTSAHNTSKKSRFSTRKTMNLTDAVTPNKSLNLNENQESTSKGSTRKSTVDDNNTSKKLRLSTKKSLDNPDVEANISNNDTEELSFSLRVSSNDPVEPSPAKTPNKSTKKSKKPTKLQKEPENDLTDVQGVKQLFQSPRVMLSPMNDLSNVSGVKKLLRTPKVQKEPQNDLTNVEGLKKLFQSPKVQHSPNNDLRDVKGVKKLLQTPKVQKSPNNDLTNVQGVKRLLRTPKPQKEPENDLTNVQGLKKLMQTPKVVLSPKNDLSNVSGVKKLLRTPKVQKEPHNDLTNVQGVKKLLQTPKEQKSPLNDLRNVAGVARLLRSPKVVKSPRNDLSDVEGVDRLFDPERLQNDLNVLNLSGVQVLTDDLFDQISPKKKLRTYPGRTPQKQEENDVSESLPASPANKEFFESWIKDQKVLKEIENLPNTAEKVELPQPKDVPIKEDTENISPKKKTRGRRIMSDHDIVEPINVVLSTEKPTQKKTAPSKTRRKNVISDDIVIESPKKTASRKNKNDLKLVVTPLKLEEVSKTRGKRKADKEAIEEPKTKTSRRGKKVAPDEEESMDDVKEDAVEEPKTKTTRRGKKVVTDEEKCTDDVKEEVIEEPKAKTSRRGKKVAPDEEESMDDVKEDAVEEPKTKTTRRGKKVATDEEKSTDDVEEPKTKTSRRGKKVAQDEEESTDDVKEVAVEEPKTKTTRRGKKNSPDEEKSTDDDKEEVIEEPKTKTSRRGKKVAADEQKSTDDVKEEVIEEPKTKTSRRGKKVAADENKDDDKEEAVEEPKTKTTRRGKKVSADDEEESKDVKPKSRSRGKKHDTEEVSETVQEDPKPKSTRGRRHIVEDVSEAVTAIEVNEETKPKNTRGRKRIVKEADQENASPTKISPKKTRRGRKHEIIEEANEVISSPKTVELEQTKISPKKRGRGTRNKNLEEAKEIVDETVKEPVKISPKKARKGRKVEEAKEIAEVSVEVTPNKSTRSKKKVHFNVPDTPANAATAEEPRRSKRTRNKDQN